MCTVNIFKLLGTLLESLQLMRSDLQTLQHKMSRGVNDRQPSIPLDVSKSHNFGFVSNSRIYIRKYLTDLRVLGSIYN